MYTPLQEDLEFLQHFGVKGQKWGVRKAEPTSSTDSKTEPKTGMSKKRKAAIIIGSAVGVAAIAAGALYAKKHMGVPLSSISSSAKGEAVAKAMAKEPTSIVHAARGRFFGWGFPQHGGLANPLAEYDKSGLVNASGETFFNRYGDRKEKVAARFLDPEGRKDISGRKIFHDVMLPEDLSVGVNSHQDAQAKVWPMIKDTYNALYLKPREGDE